MNVIKTLSGLRKQGKKIVFTNGCFDLLHPGHIKILKTAKQKGDILVVGLNSDSSVKKIKDNSRPIQNQKARIQILKAIKFVDFVIIFGDKTPYNLIKKIKPDILVKGGDWPKDKIIGKDIAKKVFRVKLQPGYSTSGIIKKIRQSAG
jgi:D-beta-D-heptose 7-phosphate kinase/D-beta-D-heptose 1-phosphate adenosyltransferase